MIDLLKHFPPHWQPWTKCPRVDWKQAGVDRKYFILTTGRSGSTHLVDLLLGTRKAGWPLEYFNEASLQEQPEAKSAKDFCEYLQLIAGERSLAGCFGFKIDIWRLESLLSLIDFPVIFPPSDTAVILMTREDKVDQAYSFAVARGTGKWHDFDSGNARREYQPTDKELWVELMLIAVAEERIERYLQLSGRNALRLTYEGLVKDRDAALKAVFAHIGIAASNRASKPVPQKFAVQPIAYARRAEITEAFKTRYAPVLEDLQQPQGFNSKAVSMRLQDEYGLQL